MRLEIVEALLYSKPNKIFELLVIYHEGVQSVIDETCDPCERDAS